MSCTRCKRYTAYEPPKTNCEDCWFMFFHKQVGKFNAAKLALEKLGRATVAKVQGQKYVKFLERYIASELPNDSTA